MTGHARSVYPKACHVHSSRSQCAPYDVINGTALECQELPLKATDLEMQTLKLKEIKNARLAMLGVAGFFAQVLPLAEHPSH